MARVSIVSFFSTFPLEFPLIFHRLWFIFFLHTTARYILMKKLYRETEITTIGAIADTLFSSRHRCSDAVLVIWQRFLVSPRREWQLYEGEKERGSIKMLARSANNEKCSLLEHIRDWRNKIYTIQTSNGTVYWNFELSKHLKCCLKVLARPEEEKFFFFFLHSIIKRISNVQIMKIRWAYSTRWL